VNGAYLLNSHGVDIRLSSNRYFLQGRIWLKAFNYYWWWKLSTKLIWYS